MEESVCYKLPLASTFLRDECVVRRVMCGMPAFQLRHGNGDELRFVEQWRVHPTQITSATRQILCATLSGTFFFFFFNCGHSICEVNLASCPFFACVCTTDFFAKNVPAWFLKRAYHAAEHCASGAIYFFFHTRTQTL